MEVSKDKLFTTIPRDFEGITDATELSITTDPLLYTLYGGVMSGAEWTGIIE